MYHNLPETDKASNLVMDLSKRIANRMPPVTETGSESCPICGRATIIERGKTVCVSAVCRHLVIESCCQD